MCRCSGPHSCPDHAADICLYVPFCIVFVVLGSVQVVSGIFYFISIPLIKLLVNIAIGCWVILTGIGTGMVSCLCTSAPRKHEFLLYCTVSVMVLNVLDVIYLEFGQLKQLFGEHVHARMGPEFELLESPTGRLITTGTALVLVIVAFVEAQLNFYLLHRCQRARTKRRNAERKNRQLYAGNDQSADLEYVIPKKPELHHQKSDAQDTNGHHQKTVQVHNKSWVFEATGDEDDDGHHYDESSVSLCSSVSPTHSAAAAHNGLQSHASGQQQPQTITTHAPPNGGAHRQRRISRVSDAASERFAMQMSSFSRCATPSPVPRSGQQTPTHGTSHHASSLFSPYSDYLEPTIKPQATTSSSSASAPPNNRLTVDFLDAARVKLKPVGAHPHPQQQLQHHHKDDSTSLTTQPDDSPYASLLAELEQSMNDKTKPHSSFSPDNTSLSTSDNKFSSKSASSSKDLEFSKELEAALQLIQELETPSEGPYLGDTQLLQHHQNAALGVSGVGGMLARSDSEKTLSAAVSLPSPEAGPLVDTTSSPPTDGGCAAAGGDAVVTLPLSASMHKLVIDVRAATTTPTTPTTPTTTGGTPGATAAAAITHGKHVFSVFCNEPAAGGSQSTSGYSSPSTSSQLTHSVRDSCETHSDRVLNSFGGSNIIHIHAAPDMVMPTRVSSASSHSAGQRPSAPSAFYQVPRAHPKPVVKVPMRSASIKSDAATSSPSSARTSSTSGVSMASDFSATAAGRTQPAAASKSFLLFKKRSKLMPPTDFQSRIFKSECLAYLTEEELVQRHQLTRNVIRNIELNVARRVKGCQPK